MTRELGDSTSIRRREEASGITVCQPANVDTNPHPTRVLGENRDAMVKSGAAVHRLGQVEMGSGSTGSGTDGLSAG